jgi:hypothetical protein
MGWVADVWCSGDPSREAADRDHAAVAGESVEERPSRLHLTGGRAPVGRRTPGVRGDDIPAEGVELELGEGALDDRGSRFGRPETGELALRRERDPGDPRPAIAGGLTDEQQRRSASVFEVLGQSCATQRRSRAFAVEVEGLPDTRRSKAGYEALWVD